MARPVKELEKELMELPAEERARLAHELIVSLDGPADEGVEEAWLEEVTRRDKEVTEGTVKGIPVEEAMKRLRDTFKR